ncbi:MAG: CRISPR-associated endonuclease Cas2 [Chloroflexota bacterium]|nr:MAG: CRISPR-associated endonuclease Cas2 [Chloroflexota bacterium]
MLYVIAYDIPDDKRRGKVAKLLEGYGARVQRSVFEADLDARGYADLRKRLGRWIVEKEDSVRFYQLCANCRGQVETIGQLGVMVEPEVLIV